MYNYDKQRAQLFTDEGQRLFLKIRDNVQLRLKQAGAVRAQEAWEGCAGDTWDMLACLDRMVELNEIHELTGESVAGQFRVFIWARDA